VSFFLLARAWLFFSREGAKPRKFLGIGSATFSPHPSSLVPRPSSLPARARLFVSREGAKPRKFLGISSATLSPHPSSLIPLPTSPRFASSRLRVSLFPQRGPGCLFHTEARRHGGFCGRIADILLFFLSSLVPRPSPLFTSDQAMNRSFAVHRQQRLRFSGAV
jgi:hypothetical protein